MSQNSELYDRALIIPGRSMTRSKSPDRLIRAWRLRSEGAYVWDVDGNRFLDMVCGLGAVSLGYREPRYCGPGVSSLPDRSEVYAAEAVLRHVASWASHARFCKTGSESCHAAYRIAKKATGRHAVIKGDWAYHGWHEWCDDAHTFAHGENLAELYPTWAHWAGEDPWQHCAAVFIEPHRWEPVDVEWLKSVRAFCDRVGALLVFDSMIYGGRYALGGASEYFGVTPDLECFGKAYGNGQAVAFVVGNDALKEHGEIVSGTYSGDVTGLSAVLDTLHTYTTEPVIETIWARGRQLMDGLKQVIPAELGTIEGNPPHCRIRFNDPQVAGPYDYRTSEARPLSHKFKDEMAKRGVLCVPDWFMTMYAHTEQQINQVIEAAAQSAKELI